MGLLVFDCECTRLGASSWRPAHYGRRVHSQTLSHNVRRLRFSLQSPKHKFGLPVGKHVFIYAKRVACPRTRLAVQCCFAARHVVLCLRGCFRNAQCAMLLEFSNKEQDVIWITGSVTAVVRVRQGEERDGCSGVLPSQQRRRPRLFRARHQGPLDSWRRNHSQPMHPAGCVLSCSLCSQRMLCPYTNAGSGARLGMSLTHAGILEEPA